MLVKFAFFLKSRLLFNVFYCFCMFVNEQFAYLKCTYLNKGKVLQCAIYVILFPIWKWMYWQIFISELVYLLKWFDGNGVISIIFCYSLYSKTIWLQGLNFSCITVNVRDGLNSEWEAATTKYIGVNKLREVLIEIASFDGNKAGCSIHSHLLAWVTKINVLII